MTASARKDLSDIQLNAYRLLHRTCGDCSGAKVDALWRPILECVSGQQPVVPIFTLNYDWTFEKLAIENPQRYHLTDGFEVLGGNWDAERFATMRPSRKKINLALFKLHGSTCWLGGMKSMGRFEERTETMDETTIRHVRSTWSIRGMRTKCRSARNTGTGRATPTACSGPGSSKTHTRRFTPGCIRQRAARKSLSSSAMPSTTN